MRLFSKIVGLVVLVGTLPLALTGVYLRSINRQALETTIEEGHGERARALSRSTSQLLGQTVRAVSLAIYTEEFRARDTEGRRARLEFLMGQYPEIQVVTVAEPSGRIPIQVYSWNEVSPATLSEHQRRIVDRFDPAGSAIRFDDPVVEPGGRAWVNVVFGLIEEEGVLAILLDLTAVQQAVTSVQVGRTGRATLLDEGGRPVADRDAARLLERTPDPAVESLPGSDAEETSGVLAYEHPADGPTVLAWARVEPAGWTVLVGQPSSEAYEASHRMGRTTLVVTVGLGLLAIAGAILLSGQIVRPIVGLVRGAVEFARGNYAYRVEVADRGEIGLLGSSFNEMGGAIEERSARLARLHQLAERLGGLLDVAELEAETRSALEESLPGSVVEFEHFDEAIPDPPPVVAAAGRFEIPLDGRDGRMAILRLSRAEPPLTDADREFVQTIAGSVTISLDNIRYLGRLVENSRMEQELQTAALVQQTLLPEADPEIPELDLAAFYESASETGGDWYGYLDDLPRRVSILIGDVTGHGVHAALVTAATNGLVKNVQRIHREINSNGASGAFDGLCPDHFLRLLNGIFEFRPVETKMAMTFFVSTLDRDTMRLSFASAAHNHPYWVRKGGKSIGILKAMGPRLGDQKDATFAVGSERLDPGDVVLWFTDGLIENESPDRKEYGERRLRKVLKKVADRSAVEIRDTILAEYRAFCADMPAGDDLTLIVGKVPMARGTFEEATASLAGTVVAVEGDDAFRASIAAAVGPYAVEVAGPGDGRPVAATIYESGRATRGQGIGVGPYDLEGLLDALQAGQVSPHLIGGDPPEAGRELALALARMAGRHGRGMDLELRGEVSVQRRRLRRAVDQGERIEEILSFCRDHEARSNALEGIEQSLKEMFMNALQHAPVDAQGQPLFEHLPRDHPFVLPDPAAIEIRYLHEEEKGDLLLEVSDPYGSLSPESLWRSFERGFKGTGPTTLGSGMGFGLSLVYRACRSMVVAVSRGRSTLFLLRFPLTLRRKHMLELRPTFHFYAVEP